MSLRHFFVLAFIWFAFTGCSVAQPVGAQSPSGRGEALTGANVSRVASPNVSASPLLADALAHEYGNYEDVVAWESLLNELAKADVVCIGEAHYDARDMETAFEIVREMARRRKIVLAVERFSHVLQPDLERLDPGDAEVREAVVDAILASKEYQTVWGSQSFVQTGFPVNTPSRPVFEAMVKWAARAGIPLIALDVSLAEREKGFGEDLAFRNAHWKKQIEKFLERDLAQDFQIVVVGGINHLTNAPDSFPSKMKTTLSQRVVSVGQRDAMYQYLSSIQVEKLARAYALNDLVIRRPEFALVNVKGIATFPHPPDYWIASHAPKMEK